MTEGQRLLYYNVKRNGWMFRILEGHTGGPFVFWVDTKPHTVSEDDVRYVLARMVLEGVKVNASLDA